LTLDLKDALMNNSLDRLIARAEGLDHETRNALVHLAAQRLLAEGVLTTLRSHQEKNGTVYDLYRDRDTGRVYVTRRPDLPPAREAELRAEAVRLLGDAP
jgi:hypothetical protein